MDNTIERIFNKIIITMKIAFYIPNRGIYQKDLSNINEGNPGIGGSEFSAVLIATNLSGKKV